MSHAVQHQESGSKGAFYISDASGEHLATMTYSRANASLIILDHTDVAPSLAEQGVGRVLLGALVDWARVTDTKVMPLCPFATAQFGKDASIRDMLGACYFWEMRLVAASLMLVLGLALPAGAQGPFGASPHQPSTTDKTGTNPLNLQQQIDVANQYVELDDLYLDTLTYRHAVPLLHRRVAIAGAVPYVYGNLTGQGEGGLGDLVASVEWIPWLSRGRGLVAGLRTTWDTATVDALGLGTHTLMPYAQVVLQPSRATILAPFVAYRFDAGGDEFAPNFSDTLVGLNVVWRVTPRTWLSAQPQVIFDRALDATYGEVAGEVGFLLTRRFSTYVHPSFGVGSDRTKPYTWGITAGMRFVP